MMKQNNWIEKGVWGLLIVLNALFLYYWVALAANYCMHYDDVHFMWKLREYSIFEYVKEMYLTRGGNFVGYTWNGIIFTIYNLLGDYHAGLMVTYFAGIGITYLVAKDNIRNISKPQLLLGIITLYNIYVLTSVDYAVFTWLCAKVYYLYAPLMCLLLHYINKINLKWWQWVLLIVSVLCLAGFVVTITVQTFIVLFVYGMILWHNHKWNVKETWGDIRVRKLIYVTISMLIIFAIVVAGPGNWNRLESGDDMNHPESLMEYIRAVCVCAGMFIYMMAFYLPYHLIAVAMGAYVGAKSSMVLPVEKKKAILIVLLLAFGYLLFSVLPLAYLCNGFGIQRNYIHTGFFYMLAFFALGYIWTNQSKTDKVKTCRWSNIAMGVCSIFLIVIMALNIRQDLPIARAYNKAHQEREAYLLELQESGNKETVFVEPYPSVATPDAKYNVMRWFGKKTNMQAIYYEADTDVEPNEYEGHIRKLLRLDFDFVLAEPKDK